MSPSACHVRHRRVALDKTKWDPAKPRRDRADSKIPEGQYIHHRSSRTGKRITSGDWPALASRCPEVPASLHPAFYDPGLRFVASLLGMQERYTPPPQWHLTGECCEYQLSRSLKPFSVQLLHQSQAESAWRQMKLSRAPDLASTALHECMFHSDIVVDGKSWPLSWDQGTIQRPWGIHIVHTSQALRPLYLGKGRRSANPLPLRSQQLREVVEVQHCPVSRCCAPDSTSPAKDGLSLDLHIIHDLAERVSSIWCGLVFRMHCTRAGMRQLQASGNGEGFAQGGSAPSASSVLVDTQCQQAPATINKAMLLGFNFTTQQCYREDPGRCC